MCQLTYLRCFVQRLQFVWRYRSGAAIASVKGSVQSDLSVAVRHTLASSSHRYENRTVNSEFKWVTFHFVVEKKGNPLTGVVYISKFHRAVFRHPAVGAGVRVMKGSCVHTMTILPDGRPRIRSFFCSFPDRGKTYCHSVQTGFGGPPSLLTLWRRNYFFLFQHTLYIKCE